MKSVQDDFVRGSQALTRAAMGLPRGGAVVTATASDSDNFRKSLHEYTKGPENRTNLLLIVWGIMVALLLIITAILVFIIFPITSANPKPGVLIAAILWGFFFGICVLFFLPPKLVTTVFGGLFGVSVSEATTATGLITSTNQAITSIATQINIVLTNSSTGEPSPFIGQVIWVFVIVMALVCLPAFFRKE